MTPLRSMGWTIAVVLGLCLGPLASMADSVDELSVNDRSAIRAAIEGQMAAFRADDAPLAFSFATPTIQDRFGDASRFIAMVRRGYQPVYRPRQVEFTDLLDVHGQPAQQVVVVGPDNGVFNAYYLMEQQPDGVWRISGCILRPLADRAI